MRKLLLIIILMTLMIGGCAKHQPPMVAGISPLPEEQLQEWGIPGSVKISGEGNSYRVVAGQGLMADKALELAAAGNGRLEYFQEIAAGAEVSAAYRVQFLSTQGTGRIILSALDANGKVVGAVSWVVTGSLPVDTDSAKWLDRRYSVNYKGNWLEQEFRPAQVLAAGFPGRDWRGVERYRISVEVGEGQHVLITKFSLYTNKAFGIKLIPQTSKYAVKLNDTITLAVAIENTANVVLPRTVVELAEPYGYGVVVLQDKLQVVENIVPGEKRMITWQVKAQRPDAVNLGNPWSARFNVNGVPFDEAVSVAVTDTRPGKVYYVMTDDLEPIDSAGYAAAWGNANGWLEPREFEVQMVHKAEKLNAIAERYGAKWTHYTAWPAVKAAEWAAKQSGGGQWTQAADAIKRSVGEQSARGHEYGIHLHSDYDPYLPGNVLSYNSAVNGLWANHLRHGWASSIAIEGGFENYTSRTGMLYAYQRIMDELSAASPQGQLITSRVGSFDFGNGIEAEAASTRAYSRVGLWGSSDADGNAGKITSGDYGHEIYLAKPDDINVPANDISQTGLVEFRPTPQQFLTYDSQSLAAMNVKADQGIAEFSDGNGIKPGIHAIVGFTHAMFVMGDGGWESVEGGQFKVIEEHLRYLKERYTDHGKLVFATATELVKAYLNYHAPQPVALYGTKISNGWGVTEYAIQILGSDIPIDSSHTHTVGIKYPLYLRDSAYRVSICKNGQPIYSTWGLPTPYNDIIFTVDDGNAKYSLKVYHNETIYKAIKILRSIKTNLLKIT